MFLDVFTNDKPILAMLHLKGHSEEEILERAKREVEIYRSCGVDSVLVENYFGSSKDVERALQYLQREHSDYKYGVNILGDYQKAFQLAKAYGASYIQIDSVCGHLPPNADTGYAQALMASKPEIPVLGGVRFKYQPVLSQRDLQTDLTLGKARCEAIVVTGDGTGKHTDFKKIEEFRNILGDFPLVVGAGLTKETVAQSLAHADAAIVGSTFKEGRTDHGELSQENVKAFMEAVFAMR